MANKKDMYPDFSSELALLDSLDGVPTIEIINDIIIKHMDNSKYTKNLYGRYKTDEDNVPIFQRKRKYEEDEKKSNHKIANDFFGEIVDVKTGYFSGEAANYSYSNNEKSQQEVGGEKTRDIIQEEITNFTIRSNMRDLDMETTKMCAIAGYCGRLMYHDLDGNEKVMITNPWESIFIAKDSISEPSYSIKYTTVLREGKEILKVEFYNNNYVYFYKGNGKDLSFDDEVPEPIMQHLYDYNPFFGIPNNREILNDCNNVLSLIDGYNILISDRMNEAEDFVAAYLFFKGVTIDEESMKMANRYGAFSTNADNADGKYITKNVDTVFLENLQKELKENIYRFSKTPNMNDQAFAGATSGIALKYKLMALENKCASFEAKMQTATTYMFKLLASSLAKKKISLNYLNCFVTFKRSFPLDLLYELDVAAKASAILPEEIWLSLLSFIDDVDYVMNLIEEQKAGITPLNSPSNSSNIDITNQDSTNINTPADNMPSGDVFSGVDTQK